MADTSGNTDMMANELVDTSGYPDMMATELTDRWKCLRGVEQVFPTGAARRQSAREMNHANTTMTATVAPNATRRRRNCRTVYRRMSKYHRSEDVR